MSKLLTTVLLLISLICLSELIYTNATKFSLKRKKSHKLKNSSLIEIPLVKNTWDMQTKKKYFDFLSESHSYLISKEVDALLETKGEKKGRKSSTSDKKSIKLYNFKNTQVKISK